MLVIGNFSWIVEFNRCFSFVQVLIVDTELSGEQTELIEIFEKMFGSKACASIPRYNDFSNFITYFIQKVYIIQYEFSRFALQNKIL